MKAVKKKLGKQAELLNKEIQILKVRSEYDSALTVWVVCFFLVEVTVGIMCFSLCVTINSRTCCNCFFF